MQHARRIQRIAPRIAQIGHARYTAPLISTTLIATANCFQASEHSGLKHTRVLGDSSSITWPHLQSSCTIAQRGTSRRSSSGAGIALDQGVEFGRWAHATRTWPHAADRLNKNASSTRGAYY